MDCWAIGVLVYECLLGEMPYEAASMKEMLEVIDKSQIFLDRSGLRCMTQEAQDFIKRCLDTEPTTRITACEMLCHPWIMMHHSAAASPSPPPLLLGLDPVAKAVYGAQLEILTTARSEPLPRMSASPVFVPSSSAHKFASLTSVPTSPAKQRNSTQQLRWSVCNTAPAKIGAGGEPLRHSRESCPNSCDSCPKVLFDERRRGAGRGGAVVHDRRRGSPLSQPIDVDMSQGTDWLGTVRSVDFGDALTRDREGLAPARDERGRLRLENAW